VLFFCTGAKKGAFFFFVELDVAT